MKTSIEILEHELSYAKGNRAECKENEDFYRGWVASLKCAIGILCSCDRKEAELYALNRGHVG